VIQHCAPNLSRFRIGNGQATIGVHVHDSFERKSGGAHVSRMPIVLRPLGRPNSMVPAKD
jgi:hypothetical protein